MVSYLLVAGATLLELLCTIFVINGLVGEKRQIPVINAIVFSVFTLMYVLLVPNVLTTGSYLIILLYVKFSYKEQREFETIDDDIAALEERIEKIKMQINANATNSVKLKELFEEQEKVQAQLDEKTERWVYLNEIAEKIGCV